ncbi:MAG: S8 family peptidase [Bacteroidales bacterium]|nr:S8 family peptidase [Bacteroidales bacterium]
MKKIVLLLVLSMGICAFAQQEPSQPTRRGNMESLALVEAVTMQKSGSRIPQRLLNLYPVHQENGVPTIGVLAKVNQAYDVEAMRQAGIRQGSRVADIVSLRMPLATLPLMETLPGIVTYSVEHNVAPALDNVRFDTRTELVQAGEGGLPQAFDGTGVLAGITDWGFDYTHINFNRLGNRRIERAWDQFRQAGPAPVGFHYGTEIVGYEDLKKAGSDTANLYNYGTHGTHVAGIVGGAGSEGHYIGQAPNVHFLMGSFLLGETGWMDEAVWMKNVAKEEGKRIVINSSWGMYTFSTLDGTSLLSQAIDHLSDSGVVFVTSAGNNGDVDFHLSHTFEDGDTLKTCPAFYGGSSVGQALTAWSTPGKQFYARIGLSKQPTGEITWSDWIYSGAMWAKNIEQYFIVTPTGDTCGYDCMKDPADPNDNRPHMLINVDRMNGYTLHLWIAADTGARVDIWNLANLANHAGNWGTAFVRNGLEGYRNGNSAYGIGEPGCARSTITVAAHRADRMIDSNLSVGLLAPFSSHGPAYGDYEKPDISAPGVNVISSISSFTTDNVTPVYTVLAGGKPYKWAAFNGTSMSCPAVTGIVALMLQANPHLTPSQIKEIITTKARNDAQTGDLVASNTHSNLWGWGKIDALAAVAEAYDKLDIERAQQNLPSLIVYPNPAEGYFVAITSTERPETLTLFAMDGRRVMERQVTNGARIDISTLPKGIYVVRTTGVLGSRTTKLAIH